MFETKNESPLESPLQSMLQAAWQIERMNKLLETLRGFYTDTTHDSVQSAANEEN